MIEFKILYPRKGVVVWCEDDFILTFFINQAENKGTDQKYGRLYEDAHGDSKYTTVSLAEIMKEVGIEVANKIIEQLNNEQI